MVLRLDISFEPCAGDGGTAAGTGTRFGGQPGWVGAPQWPLSRQTGRPMQFIGQIALDGALGAALYPDGGAGRMAYLFMTSHDDGDVDGTWKPDGGENALIIQPDGATPPVEVAALAHGPALPGCWQAVLTASADPDFIAELDVPAEQAEARAEQLSGTKLGGTPGFLQGDEFPDRAQPWRLLLQIDSSRLPFEVNFGDAGIGYAFIDASGRNGRFLWQCG